MVDSQLISRNGTAIVTNFDPTSPVSREGTTIVPRSLELSLILSIHESQYLFSCPSTQLLYPQSVRPQHTRHCIPHGVQPDVLRQFWLSSCMFYADPPRVRLLPCPFGHVRRLHVPLSSNNYVSTTAPAATCLLGGMTPNPLRYAIFVTVPHTCVALSTFRAGVADLDAFSSFTMCFRRCHVALSTSRDGAAALDTSTGILLRHFPFAHARDYAFILFGHPTSVRPPCGLAHVTANLCTCSSSRAHCNCAGREADALSPSHEHFHFVQVTAFARLYRYATAATASRLT